jgi:hypothetical protein
LEKIKRNFEEMREEALGIQKFRKFSIGLFGEFGEQIRKVLQYDMSKDKGITEFAFKTVAPGNLSECLKYDRIVCTYYFYILHKKMLVRYSKTCQLKVIIEDERFVPLTTLEPKNITFCQVVQEIRAIIDCNHTDAINGKKTSE